MKRIITHLTLMFIMIFLFPSSVLSQRGINVKEAEKKRLALVLGNGAYKIAPLKNPANDAQGMAKALREMGFEVIHKENANRKVMKKAIKDFGRRLRYAGIGLFYYAGHGIQVNGNNYLIPIKADIETESDVEFEAVDVGRVLGKMEDAGNELNIVILDACRNNPFARSFRSSNPGLAKMDAPKGSLVAYATAPGSVAADGTGRNGIYTKHLLKHMKAPGLTVEKVFKKVRIDVMRETGDKQVPWESSSLRGDFYFVIEGKITVTKVSPQMEDTELENERERLQREREELELLKIEIERKKVKAERERLKAEKERLEVASVPTKPYHTAPASHNAEIGRDGVYVAYANGIVRDTNTGLEWKVGPDKGTTWNEAKSWVQSLNLDGGGWRMPTVDELEGLYKKGKGSRNVTPLLKTTGWWVWSGETKGSVFARVFDFTYGISTWYTSYFSNPIRAFAVRSRSDG